MSALSPYLGTRRWLKAGLILAGFVAGAVFGIVLTRIGKIVADAPPADLRNYLWNAAVFGIMAGVVSPLVTWTALRSAPLWRTIVEPLALAVFGGSTAIVLGVPVLILVLPPIGLIAGFVRLHHRYPDTHARLTSPPLSER